MIYESLRHTGNTLIKMSVNNIILKPAKTFLLRDV